MSKGRGEMSDVIADAISITTIQRVLEQLLDGYLLEKEESQRDNGTYFTDYWSSACQTIEEIAAALNIPFEEKPGKQRPCKPDSKTPLGNVDVKLTEGE
jgi:hypothetical protein